MKRVPVSAAQQTAHDLLTVLPLLNRMMTVELRQAAGEDTTMPQFRVLTYLFNSPLTVSDIARLRRVSFQSAGELVQSMVERGWITRIPDPNDRRQSLLHLTDGGLEAYEQAQGYMLEHLSDLLASLSEADLGIIRRAMSLLHSLVANEVELGEQDDRNTNP